MTEPATMPVSFTRYLGADGSLNQPLPATAQDSGLLRDMYRDMVQARMLDQKIIAMQRTGRMGTYASCLGQEAIGVANGHALHADDLFVPYYRDMPTQLLRGVQMHEIMLYWGGDERGNAYQYCARDFPNCVPIATQCTHAAGAAAAFRVRREHHAVLCTLGDGATSRGDFLESLNLAGVWQLPLVFVIHNNQWAISVPRALQTAAPTLAQKAHAAGLPGEQVDGNDVIALYDRVSQALARARAGKGATLIEALTYRLGDHTTADDASRYRDAEELRQAWQDEPVSRMREFLVASGHWNEFEEASWYRDCEKRIAQAVEIYLDLPAEDPVAMFDSLYAELPLALQSQREQVSRKFHERTLGGES